MARFFDSLCQHNFAKVEDFLAKPYAGKVIFILALLLVLPSLFSGLFADDYAIFLHLKYPQLLASQHYPDLFHLFHFIGQEPSLRQEKMAFSILPWWTSTETKIVFFRPLAELSHAIDAYVFSYQSVLMHGQNVLFYAALLALLWAFYSRLLPNKVALLAFLLFAVDATHGFTVAWIANRNALMAAVFCLAACLAFLSENKTRNALGFLCFILALLCAELAASLLFFISFYALCFRQKFCQLFFYYLIFLVYLAFYFYYGFGALGSYYLNPVSDLVGFLSAFPLRFFTAFSMQFNLLPFHLADRWPDFVILCGAGIFVFAFYLAYKSRSAVVWFFLFSFSFSAALVCMAVMQERNLLLAGVAGCALLALLINALWQRQRYVLANILLCFHLLISGLGMLPMSYAPSLLNKGLQSMAEAMPDGQNEAVVTVSVPMFDASFVNLLRLWQGHKLPERFWNISSVTGVEIIKKSATQYIFKQPEGLLNPIDYLLRNKHDSFYLGQIFYLKGAQIKILALTNNQPTKILLSLDKKYAQNVQFYVWRASDKSWQKIQPANS